ncbi:ABC transporter ATP-binding protein [Saccharothrix obliqua]|uniref:ABC transporter ATP-binding protein n=1 Tax=Saccharothrix obliqua TaxID=2861747 RepID=UPI001C5D653B|nr:ABC transporter ATP-binding protein [Saccharothrix obliqua]MBW4719922.1 ABC transporter ATP-binding protein [Saccharothrix obliqua]
MEIHAQRVGVAGPHGPLLKPTSLRVPPGELLVVAGPPDTGQTALGLVLSGRLRPSSGEVTPSAGELREHVVLVDSPGVNEPEGSLSLGAVVGEELAMNGQRSGRKAVADWLVDRGADEHLNTRYEYVPADVRCAVMLELAAERPGARVLVVDTPDRYHDDPAEWLRLAGERVTPDLSVVVLCTTTSAELLGVPVARIGTDNSAPAEPDHAPKHARPAEATQPAFAPVSGVFDATSPHAPPTGRPTPPEATPPEATPPEATPQTSPAPPTGASPARPTDQPTAKTDPPKPDTPPGPDNHSPEEPA